jgi:hypothetical protein
MAAATVACVAGAAQADLIADNGFGTADLPPVGLTYTTPFGDMAIIDGLPLGTTIQIDASMHSFTYNQFSPPGVMSFPPNATGRQPGGTLGGEQAASDAVFTWPLIGTGSLAGYNRLIQIPISHEIHMAPRVNGDPVQSFATDFFRGFGQITGDPDFDLLRFTGGTDFGLPSPGQTWLTTAGPGLWDMGSYYDLTYRIDFVGAPGGLLAGMSGSTTGTVRLNIVPAPGVALGMLTCGTLLGLRRRR